MNADNAIKTCFRCKTDKPLDDFPKYGRSSDGKSNKCRVCHKTIRDAKKDAPTTDIAAAHGIILADKVKKETTVPFVAPDQTPLQKLLRSPSGDAPKSLRKPLTPEQKIARNEAAKARRAAAKIAR